MAILPDPAFIAAIIPATYGKVDAIPVIISLIIIDGLVSVYNALDIAERAPRFPVKQKRQSLKWGIN